MLNAIRRKYPNAFIGWAVESPTHKLLDLHSGIDEMILVPKGWIKKPSCWGNLRSQLRQHQFDIAIDPQGITKSAALGWISGAKKRIGIRGRWGRELSPWLNNNLVETKASHLVDRSLELITNLAPDVSATPNESEEQPVRFGLAACEQSSVSLDLSLEQSKLGDYFALINPGGSWASKRWEIERFGAVASFLKRQKGIKSLIVWAGDQELEMAKTIHQFDPDASVIAPKTDLRDLAVLCDRAAFFIGSDTGPMHLATAMGTPCIGLYGPTRPEDSGAYGPQNIAIQKWYQSGSCRKRRNADNDAMRDILAADVFEACDQMIKQLGLKSVAAA